MNAGEPVAALPGALQETFLAGARLHGVLGQGKRSTVHAVTWQGLDCVLKVYDRAAADKHRKRHPLPLARYEYLRNRRLYDAPGLRDHVARPVAFVDDGAVQAFVQTRIEGVLFERFRETADAAVLKALTDSLPGLVDRAHAVGVYDLDLHPNNVLVSPVSGGGHRLVLFDFNNIPVHERSSNPLTALLFALRVLQPASRDRRRLHLFTDPPGYNRLGTRRQR